MLLLLLLTLLLEWLRCQETEQNASLTNRLVVSELQSLRGCQD